MSRAMKVLVCVVGVGVMLVWADPVMAVTRQFTLLADGPCAGTAESGMATGTFTLDTDTRNVDYSISITGLSSNETGKHVHGPYDSCETMGGSILAFLPVGNDVSGSYVLATEQDVQDMIDGKHWINIHTQSHTGGELRGQIAVVPVPAVSEWGLAVMTLLVLSTGTVVLARRRRGLQA